MTSCKLCDGHVIRYCIEDQFQQSYLCTPKTLLHREDVVVDKSTPLFCELCAYLVKSTLVFERKATPV